jgi:lysophospholipase L1-like esterase
MSLFPLAIRNALFSEPGPRLPLGALGVWYTDQYAASPRAYIPNAVGVAPAGINLFAGSRRLFTNATLWSLNCTVTDSTATAPDGSSEASTLAGSGAWWISHKLQGSFPLAAGTYTLAVNVRWRGTGSASFQLGAYSAQFVTKTATSSWARFTAPIVSTGGNYWPMMYAAGGSSTADFEICDFELYAGSSDLGPATDRSTMLLCNADASPGASVATSLVDFSAGKFGVIQLPSTPLTAVTTIIVGQAENLGNQGYRGVLSNIQSFAQFCVGSGLSSSFVNDYAGSGLGKSQSTGEIFDRPGDGLSVMTHTLGGGLAESWVNNVKLLSAAGSASITLKDLFAGILLSPTYYGGYKIFALAVYPRKLTDQEILKAVNYLSIRATSHSLTATKATQKTVLFLGDSIASGSNGNPGYAYRVPANASPPIHGANYGVGGAGVTTLATQLSTLLPIIAQGIAGGRKVVCDINYGANDLSGAVSATTFLSNLAAAADNLRSYGAKVVLHTVLPRSQAPAIDDTVRGTANTAIRAMVGVHCDAVADIASDATMGANGAATNTTYYADGVHPTDAGHILLEPYVTAAINSV